MWQCSAVRSGEVSERVFPGEAGKEKDSGSSRDERAGEARRKRGRSKRNEGTATHGGLASETSFSIDPDL